MKKVLILFLVGTLSLLAGCSSSKNNDTPPSQSTENDVEPSDTPTPNPTEQPTSTPMPTPTETPTPEPEKNVITLMSADGKKVIHEFDIPEGYTVVSDKKGNHIELAKLNQLFVNNNINVHGLGINQEDIEKFFVSYLSGGK